MRAKYLVAAYLVYKAARYGQARVTAFMLRRKARQKRELKENKSYSVEDSPNEALILSLHAFELAEHIKQGKLTSVECTQVYIKRALKLGRDLNLTTEELFDEALALAKDRDLQLKESPESCGLLHGVPVSIKESIMQRGFTASNGLGALAFEVEEKDAALVTTLLEEGAVPFVRSNVPQALIWFESENAIYGRTCNPWRVTHSSGGSSGGESGLVAARASPLGLGGDIGGSIRIPAHFTGVYGLKPTTRRLSMLGNKLEQPENNINPMKLFVQSTPAPIGRCVDDLKVFLKATSGKNKSDLFDTPILYKEWATTKQLKIGFIDYFYFWNPPPAIKRAVQECKVALEQNGHTLVEFDFPQKDKATKLYLNAYVCEGVKPLRRALRGEDPIYFYNTSLLVNEWPRLKKLILFLLKWTGNQKLFEFLNVEGYLTAARMRSLAHEIRNFTEEFTKYWVKMGVDAVIMPAFGMVSPLHGKGVLAPSSLEYTFLGSLLKYPCGVVPVTQVQPNEVKFEVQEGKLMNFCARQLAEDSQGMPVGVQVMGKPYEDEKVLAIMGEIEKEFRFHKFAI